MKSFTPERLVHPVGESTTDIIVVGKDENGITTNYTLKDQTLLLQLNATPETVVNPARAPLVATVFQQALAKMEEDGVFESEDEDV